jgi:predicted 2-oxoglutarate/Fe(II)-dependent dioxygenase YbiX
MPRFTRQPMDIGRNDPCFCGSGQKFRRCCGATGADRKPPHGVVVVEDYLSPAECADLVSRLETLDSERLKVIDIEKTGSSGTVRKYDDSRVTERVNVADLQTRLDDLVKNAILTRIEPETGQRIEWFEEPQVLRYKPGGFYSIHADSEYFEKESQLWVKCMDRDWSLLLYLNDEFEGGEIHFTKFHYKLKPRAGTLVYFPSDGRYMHTALEVTSGVRYAVVSWMSQAGVEKLRAPPEEAVYPHARAGS